MAVKERPADIGSRRARRIVAELGRELHDARLEHGLSQAAVATAARISRSQMGRIERGDVPFVRLANLARLMAVVGLELSVRAYPAGPPIHDGAHRALIERLRARVSAGIAWRCEVPLPIIGDQRAWDAVLLIGTQQVAIEAETRPRDVQALQRRVALKCRDDPGIGAVVLLLADSRHNRKLVRDESTALHADLPVAGDVVLEALAKGRDPGGSGLVLV